MAEKLLPIWFDIKLVNVFQLLNPRTPAASLSIMHVRFLWNKHTYDDGQKMFFFMLFNSF